MDTLRTIIITTTKRSWGCVMSAAKRIVHDYNQYPEVPAILAYDAPNLNAYARMKRFEETLRREPDNRILVIGTMHEEGILRASRLIREGKIPHDSVQVVEVPETGEPVFHAFDETGEFVTKWVDGFFQYRAEELFTEEERASWPD